MRIDRVGLAAALTALIIAGCSSVSVSSRYQSAKPLPPHATYDWGKAEGGSNSTQEAIRAAVERQLLRRGYRQVRTGETPEFIVNYSFRVEQKVSMNDMQFAFTGTSDSVVQYGQPGAAANFPYRQGSFKIELVDRKDQSVQWEGLGTRIMSTPEPSSAQIDGTIRKIFEHFPIHSK